MCATASKIRDAYAFIAQNYEEGDEICLFVYVCRIMNGFAKPEYASFIGSLGECAGFRAEADGMTRNQGRVYGAQAGRPHCEYLSRVCTWSMNSETPIVQNWAAYYVRFGDILPYLEGTR